MKLWKSPALYFGILLILLVGGALAAPYLVDWSLYRADIEEFGTKLTGRSVTVEGPISVRLFPWPKLSVGKVRVANSADASEPDLLTAELIEVRMSLAGLFNGEIRVEMIDLVEPVVSFERLTSGQGTWRIAPTSGMITGKLLEHVKLDQITLRHGTINLIDRNRHGRATLDQVDAVISAPGLVGPWRLRGRADYKTKPIDIAVNTGAWRPEDPFRLSLRIAPADGSGFVYSFDGANDGKEFKGALSIEPAARPDGRSDAEGDLRPLVMTAKVTADFDTVALDKIEIAPRDAVRGTNLVSGNAHLSLGPAIKLTADLSATRFDLDAVAGARARRLLRTGGGLALLDAVLQSMPDNVEIDGVLRVTSLVAGGATLDGLKLSVGIGDDAVHIRELSANMPGQARGLFRGIFVATDAGPQLLGDISGEASSLREFVQWTWPEARDQIERIWTGSRGRLKFESKIDAGSDHIRFEDAVFQLEDSLGKGSFAMSFGERPALRLSIISDSLDLDRMLAAGIAAYPRPGEGWPALAAWLPEFAKDRDLSLAIESGELSLNGVNARDVAVRLSANDKGLDIKTIEIGQVGDAKLSLSGRLDAETSGPAGSLSAKIVAQDPRGLLQLLGLFPAGARPGWTDALGATDLDIDVGFKPDEGGRLANVQVHGKSGPLAIDGRISAAAAAEWLASEISGSAVVSSTTGTGLAKLVGLAPVVAQEAAAKFTVTATGSLKEGLLTDIEADIFGAHAQYQGNVKLGPDGWRSHGRGGVFAGRAQSLLAAFGVAGQDGVLSFESDIDVIPGKFALPALKGVLGGSPISGKIAVENGTRMSGDIATGSIRLPQLLALVFLPWRGGAPDLEGPFAASFPNGLGGELWIKPTRLDVFEGLQIGEPQVGISVDANEIRLAVAGKSGRDEAVHLEFGSTANGDGRAIDARVTLSGDLAAALSMQDRNPVAAGSLTVSARVQASGRSPAAALAALRGSGNYVFSGANLLRVDAARFGDIIAKAASAEEITHALSVLLAGGEMVLGDGKGLISIENGTATFDPIVAKSAMADVTLTPVVDLTSGSLDLSAKVQLKTSENLPVMNVSYVGTPGALMEVVDSNALESFLGVRVLERSLAELERVQREQKRIYAEEERARKEDEARLQAFFVQKEELQRRARELKAHRINQEILAQRAKAEAERAVKEARAINREEMSRRLRERRVHRVQRQIEAQRLKAEARSLFQAEMNARMRELRVHRSALADRENNAVQEEQIFKKATPPGAPRSREAKDIPLPRPKSADSNATANIEPLEPLVLVPPAAKPSEPRKFDLLDLFSVPESSRKWLKQREQTR